MKCKNHPKYKAVRWPENQCPRCTRIWKIARLAQIVRRFGQELLDLWKAQPSATRPEVFA